MGALPKKRRSNARQGGHRNHQKISIPSITICPQCRQPMQNHHACPNCGTYRGRQVFEVKSQRGSSEV